MAIQVINVGTKANGGGGDPLRDAMIKINENFAELYDRTGGDVASTIIGADSTVLVDGPNSSLNAAALSGTAPAGVVTFDNVGDTPTSLGGYGITDAYTKSQTLQRIEIAISDLADEGGDLKGSVFADDSTLLVDGINGVIPGSVIDGQISVPSISGVGGGSTDTLDLYADLLGQVSKDGQKRLFATSTNDDYFEIGTTAPYNEYQPTLKVYGQGQFGSLRISAGVEEAFATLTGATGTVTHDCDNGHIFYHTGAAADWTANFTNLSLTAEHATTLSIVTSQGATAYIPTAVEIGGVAQTLLWQGGSTPSGTADGTDVVAFSILNDGGTYVVMGQLVGFS